MATQIQLVRDRDDERELWAWLAERVELLALPRIAAGASPVDPSASKERSLVAFPADNTKVVVNGVTKMPPLGGGRGIVTASISARGYYFEFEATTKRAGGLFVVGGGQGGRIVYEKPRSPNPRAQVVESLVKAIIGHVKLTSPLLTGDRILHYVGPSLARKMTAGKARLVYPNGSDGVVVRPNPALKR